jgi:hypothetical protein
MALFKAGGLVSEVSGSVGTATFQGGPCGRVVHSRAGRRSAPSEPDVLSRARFAAGRAAWFALTGEQRSAWSRWSGGRSGGWGAYWRSCWPWLAFGVSPPSGVPVGVPPLSLGGVSVSVSVGGGTAEVAWTSGDVPGDVLVFGYVRGPLGAAQSGTDRSWRGFCALGAGSSSPVNLWADLEAVVGVVVVGVDFAFQLRSWCGTTGLWSAPASCRCTTAA